MINNKTAGPIVIDTPLFFSEEVLICNMVGDIIIKEPIRTNHNVYFICKNLDIQKGILGTGKVWCLANGNAQGLKASLVAGEELRVVANGDINLHTLKKGRIGSPRGIFISVGDTNLHGHYLADDGKPDLGGQALRKALGITKQTGEGSFSISCFCDDPLTDETPRSINIRNTELKTGFEKDFLTRAKEMLDFLSAKILKTKPFALQNSKVFLPLANATASRAPALIEECDDAQNEMENSKTLVKVISDVATAANKINEDAVAGASRAAGAGSASAAADVMKRPAVAKK